MGTVISNDVLKSLLKNPKNGPKNHFIADCPVPSCLKKEHFYIKKKCDEVNRKGVNVSFFWHCKKCNTTGNLFSFLKTIGRLDLLEFGHSVRRGKIESQIVRYKKEVDITVQQLPDISLPIGYKRIYYHPYLESRGWTDKYYERYEVGQALILSKYKDYLIFPIRINEKCKGFIGRISKSKEEITQIERQKQIKLLRYRNSVDTNFGQLLYGEGKILPSTKTVIIVEGLFDKFQIDRYLIEAGLYGEYICVCSFGKKISNDQINILNTKGVKSVILFYDPEDAIDDSKKYSYLLAEKFTTRVAYLNTEKDPGDMNFTEIAFCIINAEDVFTFFMTKVAVKKLKKKA